MGNQPNKKKSISNNPKRQQKQTVSRKYKNIHQKQFHEFLDILSPPITFSEFSTISKLMKKCQRSQNINLPSITVSNQNSDENCSIATRDSQNMAGQNCDSIFDRKFLQFFSTNNFFNLTKLQISGINLQSAEFLAFISAQKLASIKIQKNNIISFKSISKNRFPELRAINLSGNPIQKHSLSRLDIKKEYIYLQLQCQKSKHRAFQDITFIFKQNPRNFVRIGPPGPRNKILQRKLQYKAQDMIKN